MVGHSEGALDVGQAGVGVGVDAGGQVVGGTVVVVVCGHNVNNILPLIVK